MAWTEAVAGFNEFQIVIESGNTRKTHVVGTFGASQFQATFADGFDFNKAIRVRSGPWNVLGSRQDKLHVLSTHTGKVDLSETDALNMIALEIMDITNVPQNLQLDQRGYGKHSPFDSPSGYGPISRKGIDMERKTIQNGKIGSATTIEMMGDSRFVLKDDDSATASFDRNSPLMTFSPGYSDVFTLLPTSIFNVDIDTFGS